MHRLRDFVAIRFLLILLGLLSPTAGPPLVSVIGDYTGFRHDHLDRSPGRGFHKPASGSTNVVSGADLDPAKMIRQNSSATFYSQDAGATWAAFPAIPEPVSISSLNGAICLPGRVGAPRG